MATLFRNTKSLIQVGCIRPFFSSNPPSSLPVWHVFILSGSTSLTRTCSQLGWQMHSPSLWWFGIYPAVFSCLFPIFYLSTFQPETHSTCLLKRWHISTSWVLSSCFLLPSSPRKGTQDAPGAHMWDIPMRGFCLIFRVMPTASEKKCWSPVGVYRTLNRLQ